MSTLTVAVRVTLPPVAVIGMEYRMADVPGGCVSVTVNVIVFGSVKLIDDSCRVRLGDGLLAVAVTLLAKAAEGVNTNWYVAVSPGSIALLVGSAFMAKS